MTLEEKLSKTAKFIATGAAGTAACMAVGYGLGSLLENTCIESGLQYAFNQFDVKYGDPGTLGSFVGFGTGLKMTALLEFYNVHSKIKNAYKTTKGFLKKAYNKTIKKEKEYLEAKLKKTYSPLKTFGTYMVCAGIGLGLGKIVGECFENISYTNYAITYLFNTFADVHFKGLGNLFTLLGAIWGLRFKPQFKMLYDYVKEKNK